MEQTQNQHNEVLLHALETAVKGVRPIAKEPIMLVKMVMGLAPVAVHWMLTLHLSLLLVACLAGPDAKSPSLMLFLLLTYVLMFPLWLVKNLIEKLCGHPLGVMLMMVLTFLAVYAGREFLRVGLDNIFRWIGEAVQELSAWLA